MNIRNQNQLNLISGLAGINDPRLDRKKLYALNEVLFLSINAVVCGYTDWDEKLAWLRCYRPFENGIPSHDTTNRVIGLIDYREFELFFVHWVQGVVERLGGKLVNIDGKKLRASVDKQLTANSEKRWRQISDPLGGGLVLGVDFLSGPVQNGGQIE